VAKRTAVFVGPITFETAWVAWLRTVQTAVAKPAIIAYTGPSRVTMCIWPALEAHGIAIAKAAITAAVAGTCPLITAVARPIRFTRAASIDELRIPNTVSTVPVTWPLAGRTFAVALTGVVLAAVVGVPAFITGTLTELVPECVFLTGIAVAGIWTGTGGMARAVAVASVD
jgi:hypothetical protein